MMVGDVVKAQGGRYDGYYYRATNKMAGALPDLDGPFIDKECTKLVNETPDN